MSSQASPWIEYAIAGFVFLQTCRLTRPTITARTGFALVYLSISCGFLFFTVSDFAARQFEFWWTISRFSVVQAVSQLAPLPMFLSIFAAALAGAVINTSVSRERSAKWLASWSNDVRAALIIKSIEESSLIEISLTNRKSYIGWVIWPSANAQRNFRHRIPSLAEWISG